MSPNTRPANKDKHPGVVDLSPPRRTPAHKRADDEKSAEEKQAIEDSHKAGIRRLAEVEEQRPKPKPRIVTTASSTAAFTNVGMGVKGQSATKTVAPGDQLDAGDKILTPEESNKDDQGHGKRKKKRVDKSVYRQEVDAEKKPARGDKSLPAVDDSLTEVATEIDESLPVAYDARKLTRKAHMFFNDTKKDISGPRTVMKVEAWRSKVKSPGLLLQAGQSSASSHSLTSGSGPTPASTVASTSLESSDGLGYRSSDVGANDGLYRDAPTENPNPSLDIDGVFSNRRLLSSSNRVNGTSSVLPSFELRITDGDVEMSTPRLSREMSIPQLMCGLMETFRDSDSDSDIVEVSTVEHVSVKMEDNVGTSQGKKATNKNLPAGAMPLYRCEVVPTIWHWAAGNTSDPFNINEQELVKALSVIWRYVYPNNDVLFDIPPIISLTNQHLSEWRNGFTSAAASVLTSFFASDDEYLQYDARVAFAAEMVKHYRFLYADSLVDDPEEWTGMWHGPLYLQVFASQFNATSSRVHVQELGSETQDHKGAMALAAAALERTLNLIVNGEIDIRIVEASFEDNETTGNKRKRKAAKLAMWKAEPLNGPPQPFSDFLWGGATRDFMLALRRVPRNAMAKIVYEAKSVATSHKARTSKAAVSDLIRSERAALVFR